MKYKILLLLFLAFGCTKAQQIVTLSDGRFVYKLQVEMLPEPHYRVNSQEPAPNPNKKQSKGIGITVGTVKSIIIYPINDTSKKQVIIPGKNESAWPWMESNKAEKFILEDMNFDGNNDFRFLHSADYFGYDCYVYKPATGQFVYDSALSNLVGPQFDQNQKLIYENWQGFTNKGTETFQYVTGKLTLIEEEEMKDVVGKDSTIVTIKKLVNGKMETINKVEIPRNH